MNFASFDFLYFLAITFAVYFSLPDKWRNAFLLAASYFFYAYWSWKYLLLLIFTMVLDYLIALGIGSAGSEQRRKMLLTVSIVINIGILFVFKYFGLFSGLWSQLTQTRGVSLGLLLPFGISFYTFHAMSYVIDVYRRVIPAERNFTYYSGYVMFFPQLVAGPIARASHLLHQFAEPKRLRTSNIISGSYLIAKGYTQKVVFADTLAPAVDAFLGTDLTRTPILVLQAVYFFTLQIYLDFAGYTNIARGIARLFDFELVINFDRPYISASITEFWRRWHISLSTWLRDYLYIPLGGNRKGELMTYRNLLVTMLLGGLWHGANLTFVVWGGLHGLYLVVERLLRQSSFVGAVRRVPHFVRVFIAFHLVCFAWIFFRAKTVGDAFDIIAEIWKGLSHPWTLNLSQLNLTMCLFCIGWLAFESIEQRLKLPERYEKAHWAVRYAALYATILVVALFGQANPNAFIYFQF